MTAFNDTPERHHLCYTPEADEEVRSASNVSKRWFPSRRFSDMKKELCFCKRSCNYEGCISVEGKDNFSGSPPVYCHCFEGLSDVLAYKQDVSCFLSRELEQERIAAESAANEAISMILRLQVEKSALQMEARHYQQVLETRTLYDEETILELQAIISSQEADRLVLEQAIHECRQTLRKYSEIVTEKGWSGCEEIDKVLVRTALVPTFTEKTLHRMQSRASVGSLRPLPLEAKFNYVAMQTMEEAQQLDLSSLYTKDEAKTKYVVSMSTCDSALNVDSENSALEALAMTHGAHLTAQDSQNGSVDLEGLKVDSQMKYLDDAVKDCWLSILMQVSKLYHNFLKIKTLGISRFGEDFRIVDCHECSFDSRNAISQLQQKFSVNCGEYFQLADYSPDAFQKEGYNLLKNLSQQNLECRMEMLPSMLHLCWNNNICKPLHEQGKGGNGQVHTHTNSWSDIMAIMDVCILNLAEKFTTCQSRFHALKAARQAMAEAFANSQENKWEADKVLEISPDMMREFLSCTCLGCDILDLLHNLTTHLTTLVKRVEDARCAETVLGSKISTTVKQDDTVAAKEPETFAFIIHGDSDLVPEMDCKISKLAFLWSSSLEWMSNEKCRAETAFCGWDHI